MSALGFLIALLFALVVFPPDATVPQVTYRLVPDTAAGGQRP